ncbi:DUF4367 domain-containing protein [Eisenbergiella porci]|uniref:DUF4367 domain-containing protein n=1 Tax=Eisenbergiella porci TaxID=2652274 RepID=UPI002A7ED934|nr:DUF4367 domain-containing protein [Eisenbergiella porci]
MTQGKGNRDEKLIEELYEKLYWYTYEASEEEFDNKEVDAIVRLLDVLDPKEDDPKFPSDPEAAFERFKSRYGLEEEFAKENVEHKEAVSGGMDSAVSTAAGANPGNAGGSEEEAAVGFGGTGSAVLEAEPGADREPDTDGGEVMAFKEKGKKRSAKWKRRLVRLTAGAAACLVLMLSVNFGSYALKKKSFFEVVRDEVGRTKVTVTGNVDGIDDDSTGTVECNNWDEAENEIGEKILKPSYIPDGFNLEDINVVIGTVKKAITAFYCNNNYSIKFDINIYENDYYENIILFDDEWTLIEEEDGVQYFTKDNKVEAFYVSKKYVYLIRGEISLKEMKKVVEGLK